MKKKLDRHYYFRNILFVFPIILFALIGCSNIMDKDKIVLRYETVEDYPQQRQLLEEIIKMFEQENPKIKVNVSYASPTLGGFNKILVEIAGGNAPDIFYLTSDWLPMFAGKNSIRSLDTFIKTDEEFKLTNYFDEVVKACRYNNQLYIAPFHFSTDILVYNKELFDQGKTAYPNPDWTWKDFIDAAKKLTITENGRTIQYGAVRPDLMVWIRNNGGEFFTPDGKKCIIKSKETEEALTFLHDMSFKYKVSPTPNPLETQDRSDMELFMTGRVAMFPGRTFMLAEFAKLKFPWDICAPLPKGKGKGYTRLAIGGQCISMQSKHPGEAWKFVKFYTSREIAVKTSKFRNNVPAFKEVAQTMFAVAPPDNIKYAVEVVKYNAKPKNDYNLLIWNEFEFNARKIIEKYLINEARLSDTLIDIEKNATDLIAQDQKKK